jgi:deoxyribose-phosphate aldolase
MAAEQMQYAKAKEVMGVVDSTLLKPYATYEHVKALIEEAIELSAYSVCILPSQMANAKRIIKGSGADLRICVVADFPFGGSDTEARERMSAHYSEDADEIDIVVNIPMVKSADFASVLEDLKAVAGAVHSNGKKIKVIAEDAYLTKPEKEAVYRCVCDSGADFIKTSTGFADKEYAASLGNASTGAVPENLALMSKVADEAGRSGIGIKASGGIKNYGEAIRMCEAARRRLLPEEFRIGTSSARTIFDSCKGDLL